MIEQLVTRAQAGEGDAWAELYETYRMDIFRFMRSRLTCPVEDVEDLTEDVFVKVFSKLHLYTYRPGAGFRSWLYRVANNTRADFLRASLKRPTEQSVATGEENAALFPTDHRSGDRVSFPQPPLSPAEDVDARLDVQAALAALPPDQRRVVELRHFQGLTTEEAARVLGSTTDAVKKRHARAMDALREALTP